MNVKVSDFDDLVDGGEQFADDGADAGANSGAGQEDGNKDDNDDSGADAGKDPQGGAEDGKDDGDKDSKDETDANKDGKDADADKDAAKDQMVPKKALDSEKRRRRELASRLKRIEERLGAEDAEAARRSIPDPQTDPAGHATYVAQQAHLAQINDRLNFSEYQARKEHGDETVSDAFEWATAQLEGPEGAAFRERLFAHAHPYDYAVALHKEAQEAEAGGSAANSDPEYAQFLAWKKAQQGDGGNPGAQQQPKDENKAAPRPTSLAQRSSASGPKASDRVEDPFESEFSR